MPEPTPSPDVAALAAECERLRAELRASEERQKMLFASSPLPVWIYDTATLAFLAVNDAAIRTYGYSREEFLALTIRDIRPPGEVARLDAHLPAIASTHEYSGSWLHRRKNGELLAVEIYSHGIAFEGRSARLVVALDVTTRTAAEEKLRRSEERFQLVSRATSDAIWDRDVVTGEVWLSESFSHLFGHPRANAAVTLDWWTDHIHPEDRERVTMSVRRAVETGACDPWSEEYRFRKGDGSYAIVQDRGQVVRDAAGRPVRVVGGMTDITEHKKLLTQYLRAQRMESIGTLAGGIAHDLNNVLAPILMSVELLRMNVKGEAAQKLVSTVEQSARRGADLVRQVLTFARGLDGGKRVAIKVDHLVKDVARFADETFPRTIRTEVKLERDLWAVSGDATQIHQILLNLVVNARDAMPSGGTLGLSAANVTIDEQYAATSRDAKPGAYLCVSIADTGVGIAREHLSRIFEPFFTTKEVGQGTGLGLSTAKAIVVNHGGFMTVESEFGKGAMFKVYLPADPTLRATPLASSAVADLPRGRGETILVIDDESSIRAITQQTLETFGYRVLTAGDGAEGVAVYAQHRDQVALVLTDLLMPIMDGSATVNALLRINPRALIVAASGVGPDAPPVPVPGSGVARFLPKPYTAETLLTTLRGVLRPDRPTSGHSTPPM